MIPHLFSELTLIKISDMQGSYAISPRNPPLSDPNSPTPQFHVDNLSSAHVYLRLRDGESWDNIPEDLLVDCAQLTKANSIEGPPPTPLP
jgi:hypothetical protein